MKIPAFSFLVWTPARSDRGWTRGMPPPPSHSCRRPAIRATISESNPPAKPVTPVAIDEDSLTVSSYISTPALPHPLDAVDHFFAEGDDPFRHRHHIIANAHAQTRSVHGGERVRGGKKAKAMLDAIQTPIVQSATFTFRSTRDCIDYNRGTYQSFEYGRYGNPTTRATEEKIMALEGTEDCLMSSSGMNSVTTMLLALVPQNGHIIVTTDCYRRTRQFVDTLLPKLGVTSTVLDPADLTSLSSILQNQAITMYFSESPTNPLMRVVDIPEIVRLCRAHNVISVFDTTFATPINIRPAEFGADLVLHSGTKYLAGHHDVLCGALTGRADLIANVRKLHGVLGGVVDPHAAFLINRGLKTLGVRMEAHNRNASTVARYLSTHPKIRKVHFPSLESHKDYAIATKLFDKGFGGVLSFELRGDGDPWSRTTFEVAGRFVDGLRIPYIGPSLGGCETMVEQVCILGYFHQPRRERKRLGINNGLIRLACGIEDTNDLIDDIEASLRLL